jgi:predicted CXXCH cytochrome family protein
MQSKQPKFQLIIGFSLGLLVVSNVAGAEYPSANTNAVGYAGSASCRDCHRVDYDFWSQSHHALAERPLNPNLDQKAFDPSRIILHASQTNTVRIQNGTYQIVTLGLESNLQPYRIERVIGQDPLTQFLTPAAGGRYQVHEATYDPKSNQWFYVYGDDIRNPGEFGHWTGRGMNWNSSCAECHNTRLQKNYDAVTDSYHTTMAEMSVGCEACHGPLKNHVDWQQAHPKTSLHDPTIEPLSPARIVGLCGSCHSRTTDLTEKFRPGDSFYDHYSLEILDSSQRWYPDGQVKDEDYEFVSFISSKMYQAGVTCLDCHNPHSAKNTLQGNELCMRCHKGGYPKAPVINLAEHTHHKLTDHGSDCVGCHMPVTVYMQRDSRRDHGFTIPDPLLTKELNIPNACNRCHASQTTDWALKYTEQWFGTNMNRSTRERTRWIAAADSGAGSAKGHLVDMLADTNQAAYWQAVAATFLEQWPNDPAVQTTLLAELKNAHPLVREKAVRSLEPMMQNTNILSDLKLMLNDPVRNVREATAWTLRATVDMNSPAGLDLQEMLDLEADQPTGQFEEAMFLLARQQPDKALKHLQKATAWDPLSPPFLCTQAEVQDQLGQLSAALKTLDQAEAAVPDDPHIPYVRAMILARNGRDDEARIAANRSLKIQPDFKLASELLQKLPANH